MGRKAGSKNKKKEQKPVNQENLRPQVEKIDRGVMALAKKKVITLDDLIDDDDD